MRTGEFLNHYRIERPLGEGGMGEVYAAEDTKLKRLIARSERGILSPEELAEYRALARRSEQASATRLQELAEQIHCVPGHRLLPLAQACGHRDQL